MSATAVVPGVVHWSRYTNPTKGETMKGTPGTRVRATWTTDQGDERTGEGKVLPDDIGTLDSTNTLVELDDGETRYFPDGDLELLS